MRAAVPYDGEAARRCLDAAQEVLAACGDALDIESAGVCDQVFQGTKPDGAECTSSLECVLPAQGHAVCAQDEQGVRRCDQQPRGSAGDACEQSCEQSGFLTSCSLGGPGDARCFKEDGLYCHKTDGVCAAVVPPGGQCASWEECADETSCSEGLCTVFRTSVFDCR
jgi:hypothetical protein